MLKPISNDSCEESDNTSSFFRRLGGSFLAGGRSRLCVGAFLEGWYRLSSLWLGGSRKGRELSRLRSRESSLLLSSLLVGSNRSFVSWFLFCSIFFSSL